MKKIEMIKEIIEHLKNTNTFNSKLFVNYAYSINDWARIENKEIILKEELINLKEQKNGMVQLALNMCMEMAQKKNHI